MLHIRMYLLTTDPVIYLLTYQKLLLESKFIFSHALKSMGANHFFLKN